MRESLRERERKREGGRGGEERALTIIFLNYFIFTSADSQEKLPLKTPRNKMLMMNSMYS